MHDPLGPLLIQADAVAGLPPAGAGDLARRVRDEAARRRRVRIRAGAGAALAALLLVAVAFHLRSTGPELTKSVASAVPGGARATSEARDVGALARRVAALRAEADGREAAVVAMVRSEALSRPVRSTQPAVDPLERIRAERDLGAQALVRQADRQYRDPARKDSAVATYGRVVELFPTSHWASVARQRLSEIGG